MIATDSQGDQITLGYDQDDLLRTIDDGRGSTATLAYNPRGLLASRPTPAARSPTSTTSSAA